MARQRAAARQRDAPPRRARRNERRADARAPDAGDHRLAADGAGVRTHARPDRGRRPPRSADGRRRAPSRANDGAIRDEEV